MACTDTPDEAQGEGTVSIDASEGTIDVTNGYFDVTLNGLKAGTTTGALSASNFYLCVDTCDTVTGTFSYSYDPKVDCTDTDSGTQCLKTLTGTITITSGTVFVGTIQLDYAETWKEESSSGGGCSTSGLSGYGEK